MRCLTNSEIHKWLAGQGMRHQPLEAGVPFAGDFPSPAESSDRQILGDYLADLMAKDGNKLIEILPGPQFGSGEWEQLDTLRAESGEERSVITAPGHLFKSGDREAFRQLLHQLSGSATPWTFYIYGAPSRTIVRVGASIAIWSLKKGPRNELGRHLAPEQAA
ncbi:MAG: hypothetical protein V4640_07160 [Verrucomicrobiota bacterium]